MKIIHLLTALSAFDLSVSSFQAAPVLDVQPSFTVFCLGSNYSKEEVTKLKAVLPTTLASHPAGSSFAFIASDSLATVAQVQIPKLAVDTLPQQIKRMNPQLGKLWAYLASSTGSTSGSNSIDVPRVLSHAAAFQPTPSRLVFLDSPVFHLDAVPAFSFHGLKVPSDIAIETNFTVSAFGRVGSITNRLSGCQVHWYYCGEQSCFPFALYKEAVSSFWAKYLAANFGASLVTFSPDLNQLDRLKQSNLASLLPSVQLNRRSAKVEMLVVRAQTPGAEMPLVPDLPIEVQPLAREIGELCGAGLAWTEPNCDVDIFFFPSPDGQPIYYGRKEDVNKNFLFHKDWQSGTGAEFEWVEFKNSRAIDWSQAEIWANLYQNSQSSTTPIRGKYLIALGQKRYLAGEFELISTVGNKGVDVTNRRHSAYWTRIPVDPSQVLISAH